MSLVVGAAAATVVARAARGGDDLDLALVLAVDCSSSVDDGRYALQRTGYARAFADPRLGRAVGSGPKGAIAVTLTQWAGPYEQIHAIGWQILRDPATARGFGALVDAMPRHTRASATSISGAIDHARTLIERAGFAAARRVIDVSGDGMNNTGRRPESARDEAVAAGIVINGLPILTEEPNLDEYYAGYVIGGPAAFVAPALNLEVFGAAVLGKLMREVAGGGLAPAVG